MSNIVDSNEENVEIYYYLRVVWKWKFLIICGTLLCTLLVGLLSYHNFKKQPQLFETTSIIHPGVKKKLQNGNIQPFIEPKDLINFIEGGARYKLLDIISKSNEDGLTDLVNFSLDVSKQDNTLTITYKTYLENEGLKKLDLLFEVIKNNYNYLFHELLSDLEEKIQTKKMEMEMEKTRNEFLIYLLKTSLMKLKAKTQKIINEIAFHEKRIIGLKKDLETVVESRRLLQKTEENLENSNDQNVTLLSILNSNIVQQNINSENQYKNQIMELNVKVEMQKFNYFSIRQSIISLETIIGINTKYKDYQVINKIFTSDFIKIDYSLIELSEEDGELQYIGKNIVNNAALKPDLIKINVIKLEEEIESLKREKNDLQNIRVLQKPKTKAIQSNSIRVNCVLGFIISFFLMGFLSFFIEYVMLHKNKIQSQTN